MENADTIPYSAAFQGAATPLSSKDTVENKSITTKSLFSVDNRHNQQPQPRLHQNGFQPFWFLFGSLFIIGLINLTYHKWFVSEITSFFRFSSRTIINQEKENRKGVFSLIFYLIFFFNIAVFIRYSAISFQLPFFSLQNPLLTFLLVTAIIAAYSIIKKIITAILTVLFSDYSRIQSLFQIDSQTVLVYATLLLPLNFIYIYTFPTPVFAIIILIISALLFVFRLVKLFINIRTNTTFHNYQIILYLCSLEILPVVVLVKYLVF